MDLLSLLNTRYAAKRMNGQKVPQEKLDNILESIRMSASSIGLQPYNILVVEDQDVKEKIKAVAFNQPQLTEASHVLVFAAWDNVTQERVDQFIQRIVKTRNVTEESQAGTKAYLTNILNRSEGENFTWTARQAYIALGTALIAAAAENIDATPMEGFDNAGLDALLGLPEKGLKSVALLPLGYRDAENDWLVKLPKVRTEKEILFINVDTEVVAA
jgi:nitroreductase